MSITNAELKKVHSLASRKGRRESGQFLAEGIRLLEEAFRFNIRPHQVFWTPAAISTRGKELVSKFVSQKVPCLEVSPSQLERMADARTAQGLLAVFKQRDHDLEELMKGKIRSILVADGVSDPGNVGTLIRSAVAFGFDAVALTEKSADPYSPKVVRSTVGALFGIKLAQATAERIALLASTHNWRVVVADIDGADEFEQVTRKLRKQKLLLVLGSEASGPTEVLKETSDVRCFIAHEPGVESLNSAIAGSMLMKVWYDNVIRRQS